MEGFLTAPPPVLRLADHPIRWSMLVRLAQSDYRVQELVDFLRLPQNLVSYHLRQLRNGFLVRERRSSADERAVYYSLDMEQFRTLYLQAGEQLHPVFAVPDTETGTTAQAETETEKRVPRRVLFLCTGNSARSQMAEALLRKLSRGTIEAYSAGSHPAEHVHPFAVRVMEQQGIDMSQARPKHFDKFVGQHFDAIVTVCDRIREVCPVFPGDPTRIHWSFPDPVEVAGTEEERYRAFEQISLELTTRIRLLITLLERKRQQSVQSQGVE